MTTVGFKEHSVEGIMYEITKLELLAIKDALETGEEEENRNALAIVEGILDNHNTELDFNYD